MGESVTALGKNKVNDKMLICVKCLTDMRCEKNGVLVARDPHHVQNADLYKCPECAFELLTGAGNAHNWEYARELYARNKGQWRDLYKIDTKEFIEAEPIEV